MVVTDNESPFGSTAVKSLWSMIGTSKLTTTVYHPEGNSPIEVFHRTFGRLLRKIRQKVVETRVPVEEAIAWALLSYRAIPHTVTLHSPSFLVTGVNIQLRNHEVLANHPKDILQEGRLALLAKIRTEVRIRALKARAKALQKRPELGTPILKPGIQVIVQLTERQRRIISGVLGGMKLVPAWSLPMVCQHVSPNGWTGRFYDHITNTIIHSHQSRVQVLPDPWTDALSLENQRVIRNEAALMSVLGSGYEATSAEAWEDDWTSQEASLTSQDSSVEWSFDPTPDCSCSVPGSGWFLLHFLSQSPPLCMAGANAIVMQTIPSGLSTKLNTSSPNPCGRIRPNAVRAIAPRSNRPHVRTTIPRPNHLAIISGSALHHAGDAYCTPTNSITVQNIRLTVSTFSRNCIHRSPLNTHVPTCCPNSPFFHRPRSWSATCTINGLCHV